MARKSTLSLGDSVDASKGAEAVGAKGRDGRGAPLGINDHHILPAATLQDVIAHCWICLRTLHLPLSTLLAQIPVCSG